MHTDSMIRLYMYLHGFNTQYTTMLYDIPCVVYFNLCELGCYTQARFYILGKVARFLKSRYYN